jgi:formylmethanofuran--tetrahydromethanopterin N-formyltransferase
MDTEITEIYAEAFEGLHSRVIITADDKQTLQEAANDATAYPSIVIGRIEGGVEKWLDEEETPDGRKGAVLQFWGGLDRQKPLRDSLRKFEREMSYRIRQDILVKPFTSVFNNHSDSLGKIDVMESIGHCGDGYEWESILYGRNMIVVPTMVPDFLIERELGYAIGVMGANFWYLCDTKEAVLNAGRAAIQAINQIEGVITPFGICSAGSKPETKFPKIGPTTNHPYCPSLRGRLGDLSKVPKDVHYIPEIVINGITLNQVKMAMRVGIEATRSIKGVKSISAGNYGGKLGKYKIPLRELFL